MLQSFIKNKILTIGILIIYSFVFAYVSWYQHNEVLSIIIVAASIILGLFLYIAHDPLRGKYEEAFGNLNSDIISTLTISRITKEIVTTNKRINVNLIIGILFAVVGILILYSFREIEIKSNQDLYKYIPKLSLVLFIEVFAYFFLNLYKKGLDEIKYYHNELTSAEARSAAIGLSKISHNNQVSDSIIEKFFSVERNPILAKNETTIELEKLKTDNESTKNLITVLSEIHKKG